MPKDAYFFPHDCNARHDPKILKMRTGYKLEGLGLYWAIIEMMREQEGYMLPIDNGSIQAYALDLNCTPELLTSYITDCVSKFNLFQSDDHFLWSDSLLRRMSRFDEKSEQARGAALRRWSKDMRTQCERNADAMPTQSERINDENLSQPSKELGSDNADAMPTQSERNASKVKYSTVHKSTVDNIIKLPNFIDKDLWDDFMEIRKKKRIPNTDRAKRLLIDRLSQFQNDGYNPNKIIEESIMRGWTGVFAHKEYQNSKIDTEQSKVGKYNHMVVR